MRRLPSLAGWSRRDRLQKLLRFVSSGLLGLQRPRLRGLRRRERSFPPPRPVGLRGGPVRRGRKNLAWLRLRTLVPRTLGRDEPEVRDPRPWGDVLAPASPHFLSRSWRREGTNGGTGNPGWRRHGSGRRSKLVGTQIRPLQANCPLRNQRLPGEQQGSP